MHVVGNGKLMSNVFKESPHQSRINAILKSSNGSVARNSTSVPHINNEVASVVRSLCLRYAHPHDSHAIRRLDNCVILLFSRVFVGCPLGLYEAYATLVSNDPLSGIQRPSLVERVKKFVRLEFVFAAHLVWYCKLRKIITSVSCVPLPHQARDVQCAAMRLKWRLPFDSPLPLEMCTVDVCLSCSSLVSVVPNITSSARPTAQCPKNKVVMDIASGRVYCKNYRGGDFPNDCNRMQPAQVPVLGFMCFVGNRFLIICSSSLCGNLTKWDPISCGFDVNGAPLCESCYRNDVWIHVDMSHDPPLPQVCSGCKNAPAMGRQMLVYSSSQKKWVCSACKAAKRRTSRTAALC